MAAKICRPQNIIMMWRDGINDVNRTIATIPSMIEESLLSGQTRQDETRRQDAPPLKRTGTLTIKSKSQSANIDTKGERYDVVCLMMLGPGQNDHSSLLTTGPRESLLPSFLLLLLWRETIHSMFGNGCHLGLLMNCCNLHTVSPRFPSPWPLSGF
jgi:hypothetical protein